MTHMPRGSRARPSAPPGPCYVDALLKFIVDLRSR